jgi:hypothetical protein
MSDDFAREATKRAVATAALAFDFEVSNDNLVESLADVVRHYVEKLGNLSKEVAETGGRAKLGVQDVVVALNKLVPEATSWRELRDFGFESVQNPGEAKDTLVPRWVQPFPSSVTEFPVNKRDVTMVPEYDGKCVRGANVPNHLPPFPPEHTYKRTENKKKRSLASAEAQQMKRVADNRSMAQAIARIESHSVQTVVAQTQAQETTATTSFSSDVSLNTLDEATALGKKGIEMDIPTVTHISKLSRKDLGELSDAERVSLGIRP